MTTQIDDVGSYADGVAAGEAAENARWFNAIDAVFPDALMPDDDITPESIARIIADYPLGIEVKEYAVVVERDQAPPLHLETKASGADQMLGYYRRLADAKWTLNGARVVAARIAHRTRTRYATRYTEWVDEPNQE